MRADGATASGPRLNGVVFRNSLSLTFPPSEIEALQVRLRQPSPEDRVEGGGGPDANRQVWGRPQGGERTPLPDPSEVERIELTPAFFSLLGGTGALPTCYTELLAEHEHLRRGPDPAAARAFFDIFLHRLTVLFYQAWRKHRQAVRFDGAQDQHFRPLILCLAGVGPTGMRDRLKPHEGGVADDALAFYAAALQRRPVSAATVQRVLQHYFDTPVRLQHFVGRWFNLPAAHRCHLGVTHAGLGRGAVVGERVWQRDLRLRLVMGPLSLGSFRRFLPGGPAALALKELLTLLTGSTLEYEVKLILRANEVRGCRLALQGPRLGHDSFLITRASSTDRDDATYDVLCAA